MIPKLEMEIKDHQVKVGITSGEKFL